MVMATKYFGEITVKNEELIRFPQGLFGFEDNKEFVIVQFEPDNDSIFCLQSIEKETLAFVLINPFYLENEYNPDLNGMDLRDIEADSKTSLAYYVICVVNEVFEQSTVNMKCPIVVNCDTRKAKQVILENDEYSMRQVIASFNEKEAAQKC